MEELDLVTEPDIDLNKELAPYPLPLTYAESCFMMNAYDLSERITKYGDFCWHVRDVFTDYDLVYDFVQKIPYTYNKELNSAAYLYRSTWTLPGLYNQHLSSFISEVTDLPNNIGKGSEHAFFNWTSSFFTKAWYDMHYIDMSPHQDDAGGGIFDITQKPLSGSSIPYVILVYMNDGFGTSLYNCEGDHKNMAKMEVEKGLTNFNFINLEYRKDWEKIYKEVMVSPGQRNSAFIFPANCPHRVSKYKASTPVEEFAKKGRYYLMYSFEVEFI